MSSVGLLGKNVGNYRVVAKIGEGGMGSVFLGEHPMIGKKVAIKTLHPDLAQKEDIVSRFFTEAKAVNDIGHPNIVDIVDFGKMPDPDGGADIVYFVMEFLDGEGLNQRLKREGMSPRDTVHLIKQCASALAASHRKGIVHRDLKPENIYLIRRGEDPNYCKLLDFGIAKLTGDGGEISQHKTRTGLVIGTPSYMSPEQCEGKGQIDHRSDVYSLGVVMYEMLTGRVPFPGDGFGEVLVAHLTKTPDLPSSLRADVPAGLEAIVMHMLEKNKAQRFQSMDELLAALEDPSNHMAQWGSPSGRVEAAQSLSGNSGAATSGVRGNTGQGPRIPTGQGPRVPTGQGPRVPTGENQRPTTLSGANGEVGGDGYAAPARSRAPLYAVLGLLVVGGGAAAVMLGKGQAKPEPQPAAAVVVEKPKAPETIKVVLHSTPEGAQVIRAGHADPVGTTPHTFDLKSDERDFDVLVQLEGYKSETRTVNAVKDHDMLVALTKLPPEPTPTPIPVVEPPRPTPAANPTKAQGAHHGGKSLKKSAGDKDDVMEPTF